VRLTAAALLFCVSFLLPLPARAEERGAVSVPVSGVEGGEGRLVVLLFDNRKGFPVKTDRALRRLSVPASLHAVSIGPVPYGTYAVSVFHDEDAGGKLDANFLGMPREGVGTSNNPRTSFGPPTFRDASFQLDTPVKEIEISLRYL